MSLLTALAMGLAAWPVDAAVKHWQGDVSGNWNTAGNWLENAVPVNGDQLEFSAATRYTITNDMTGLRVDRITFTDGGYVVRGNGITVTNGLTSAPPAPATGNELQIDLTLGASQTFRCDNTNLSFIGQINLGANTLTVTNAAGTEVTIGAWAGTGLISGTGGITKDGAGTLSFAGWSVANTYSGPTYVKNGTLLLGRTSVPSVPGPGTLTIGDGSGSAGSAVVRYAGADQIGSVPVVVNADGLLDLAGFSDTIGGSLTLNGGDVTLGTGTLTLGGNVSVSSSDSVINGPSGALNLSATRTFDVASGVMFDLQAPVTGAGGITKTGNGILRPGYPNTYAGLTVVQAGFVEMWTATALGASTSGTVVSNGATLQFRAGLAITNEALTLYGPGFPGYGTLRMWQSGTSSWTGPITLATDSVILVDNAAGLIEVSGSISGLGGVTKTGPGALTYSGDHNTYTGTTRVNAGTLLLNTFVLNSAFGGPLVIGDGSGTGSPIVRLGIDTEIPNNVLITINAGGLLDLNNYNETIGPSLTLNGGTVQSGTATLTLSDNSTITAGPAWGYIYGKLNIGSGTCTIQGSGGIALYANISGSANIVKNDYLSLQIYGSNIFTGTLTANGGGLIDPLHALAFGATNGGTVINDGVKLELQWGITFTNEALTMNSSGSPALDVLTGMNSWTGPVNLGRDTRVQVRDSTTLDISGPISGAGGITKTGPGTLTFSGASDNLYLGNTTVSEGILELNKANYKRAVPYGTLRIGDGAGGDRTDIVRYTGGTFGGIAPWTLIVVTNSGLLDLNGRSDGPQEIILEGGDITLGTGTLYLSTILRVWDAVSVINGPGGAIELLDPVTFAILSGIVFDLQAPVTGTGGMVKAGAGRMRLSHPNTYSGLTVVQQGFLEPSTALALGATSSGTVVSNGATLTFRDGIGITNEALTLNGPGVSGYGALDSEAAGTNIWAGPITLNADSTIVPYAAGTTWRIIGPVSGPGGLTESGSGTLVLEGPDANTYGGITRVDSGTLLLGKSGVDQAIPGNLAISGTVRLLGAEQISNNANVTINSSGSLQLVFYPESIGGLSGSGYLELGYSGLDVGYNNGSGTFSGVIAGAPVDEAGLRKVAGNGTITLTGTNTYKGITYANSGTLLVNGYQPQSPVTVGSGGTFGGTGTVGHITANGRLWPGASPGLLTSSNLSFTGTGNYAVELNGTTAGTGYDQLKVRGSVSLGSASLNATLGFPSAISNSFTLIDNDGSDAVSGTFAGLAEGATVNVSGTPFRISYTGGGGNDVVLTQLTATQRPLLRIAPAAGTDVVLWWPTIFTGYTLEANTNLSSNVWSGVSPAPVVGGTNNYVTNAASGLQNHYRLRIP